jgi:hypothetical protein
MVRADEGFAPFELLNEFVLATDAYIHGYRLVAMEMTRRVITNATKLEGTHAPMGQIVKLRQYPNATFQDVTAPNADTLYATAFSTSTRRRGFSVCPT